MMFWEPMNIKKIDEDDDIDEFNIKNCDEDDNDGIQEEKDNSD